jgi:hypothetical protein
MIVCMSMAVIMSSTASRNPQALVHRHKHHEANQDAQSQDQVPVRLHKHKSDPLLCILANEDLGEKVEEGVAEQATNSESDHDGERSGVNVGRAESEKEVRRTGDVQGRKQGVHSWGAGEEDREDSGRER